jgi:acetylornithine deacetylase/succinyl-diaminopimelate desuccinylase-like protein
MGRHSVLAFLLALPLAAQTPSAVDWSKADAESVAHFRALVQLDTTSPPGNEVIAVEYVTKVLEAEGIPVQLYSLEAKRPNLVARLKGNGSKKPLLIMGHTDTVNIDAAKWEFPPFSAAQDGGFIYGRGTVDDKDNLAACLMAMLLLKRSNVPLDRDVIFLAEAGEEGDTRVGIGYMVANHWPEIEAEYAIAEGGGISREKGRARYASIGTTEKSINTVSLVAKGPAGHGSVPLRGNAVVHLSQAVAKVAAWMPPMRLNDTTRTYFERLSTISSPEDAARYTALLNPAKTMAVQEYFVNYEPRHNSMIRTSISPNIFTGGYRYNVIPSEATARLDVRSVPDEPIETFLAEMKKVINDPAVEIVYAGRTRPAAPPSPVNDPVFRAIESAIRKHYGVVTLPTMGTGGTDLSFLRSKGVKGYGVGPASDAEDGPLGFGAHSDQERILEAEFQRFVRYQYDAIVEIAGAK